MAETFEALNDYTLGTTVTLGSTSSWARGITRLFNFKAQQVTTVSFEWMSNSNGNAVANTTSVQNFADVESKDEIRAMHAKLLELNGKPPAIEDILPDTGKKNLRLPANTQVG